MIDDEYASVERENFEAIREREQEELQDKLDKIDAEDDHYAFDRSRHAHTLKVFMQFCPPITCRISHQ